MTDRKTVRRELTGDQRAQVKAATGQDPNAGEPQLEERIAPIRF